jgi:hypothetical protein
MCAQALKLQRVLMVVNRQPDGTDSQSSEIIRNAEQTLNITPCGHNPVIFCVFVDDKCCPDLIRARLFPLVT